MPQLRPESLGNVPDGLTPYHREFLRKVKDTIEIWSGAKRSQSDNATPPLSQVVTFGELPELPEIPEQVTEGLRSGNLITNSGFGVWSNSTLENVGLITDLSPNNHAGVASGLTEANAATGWLGFSANTVASSTDFKSLGSYSLKGTRVDSAILFYRDFSTVLTARKLYRIVCKTYDPTATGGTAGTYVKVSSALSSGFLAVSYTATRDSWVTHTLVFEAPSSGACYLSLHLESTGVRYMDEFSLYEVTPGCIAADVLACDGWGKEAAASTYPDIYREHAGSNTKAGSFYSLKFVATETDATGSNIVSFPKLINTYSHWLESFKGRTVTFGCWVKCDTAATAKIGIRDSTTNYWSDANVGTDWEWLEVTRTVSTNCTNFGIRLTVLTDTKIAYFSQPMLIFGSAIGEGNYAPIPNEIINCEALIISSKYYTTGFSDETPAVLNLCVDSNGKIPKGVKRIKARLSMNDSGSATFTPYMTLNNGISSTVVGVGGIAADKQFFTTFHFAVKSDNTVNIYTDASGVGTLDLYMIYSEVML